MLRHHDTISCLAIAMLRYHNRISCKAAKDRRKRGLRFQLTVSLNVSQRTLSQQNVTAKNVSTKKQQIMTCEQLANDHAERRAESVVAVAIW